MASLWHGFGFVHAIGRAMVFFVDKSLPVFLLAGGEFEEWDEYGGRELAAERTRVVFCFLLLLFFQMG